jgi:hypothetical protein
MKLELYVPENIVGLLIIWCFYAGWEKRCSYFFGKDENAAVTYRS